MKLNHLNLTVTDVAETRKLFETYFGFTGLKEVGNEKFALLFGEDGFVLNLMRGAQVSYPETFHIGFIQESEERVNEINRHLCASQNSRGLIPVGLSIFIATCIVRLVQDGCCRS